MYVQPFSRAEYEDRLTRVRMAMELAEIDLLWITDPSNMNWLTGYDGWSFYVHQGVLVSHDDYPKFWGRNMDAQGAVLTCWMGEEHCFGYSDELVQTPFAHPMEDLAHRLSVKGARTIGVEMDNYYYSAKAHAVLQANLEGKTLVDVTGLVNWQRTVKSQQELTYMRRAARIVEEMHRHIADTIAPGMRKNDLVAGLYHTGITGADGHGGDYPAIVPLLPTGIEASAPHLTWDDTTLERGAGTFFEIAGCYRRYHVPQCRSVYLGQPPEPFREAEQALLEGLEAGIDAARAGAEAADVAAALSGVFRHHGIEKESRCGYPVGLSYPPDWGERTISFRADDHTILEPGMTFHFMPGLWFDDWGIEITETILIHEEGPAECLAVTPREVVVVD